MTCLNQTILTDTLLYAKKKVVMKVMKISDPKHIEEKIIYVRKKLDISGMWKAALIDAQCQSGKTWKCFQLLCDKLQERPEDTTLVLFVTQANCTMSANQIIQRARNDSGLTNLISSNNIYRSAHTSEEIAGGNHMLVDFWNSKCMSNMTDFVKRSAHHWDRIISSLAT